MTSSRSHSALVAGVTLLVALDSGAARPGEVIHVGKNPARLFNIPSVDGQLLKTLPPGAKLIWRASGPKDKGFEFVTFNGSPGFVLASELALDAAPPGRPAAVQLEGTPSDRSTGGTVTRDGKVNAFGPDLSLGGGARPAGSDPLQALEEANDRAATDAAIAAHAKAARLKVGKR